MVGPNPDGYLENVINPLIKKYKINEEVSYIKPQYDKNLIELLNFLYKNNNFSRIDFYSVLTMLIVKII